MQHHFVFKIRPFSLKIVVREQFCQKYIQTIKGIWTGDQIKMVPVCAIIGASSMQDCVYRGLAFLLIYHRGSVCRGLFRCRGLVFFLIFVFLLFFHKFFFFKSE